MKSKTTQALEIPHKVKESVHKRDNGCDIWDGTPVDVSCSCCHYIPRTHSGLGIEQNIVTLSPENHRLFDKGPIEVRMAMEAFIKVYLMTYYANWGWTEEKLKYKRSFENG